MDHPSAKLGSLAGYLEKRLVHTEIVRLATGLQAQFPTLPKAPGDEQSNPDGPQPGMFWGPIKNKGGDAANGQSRRKIIKCAPETGHDIAKAFANDCIFPLHVLNLPQHLDSTISINSRSAVIHA